MLNVEDVCLGFLADVVYLYINNYHSTTLYKEGPNDFKLKVILNFDFKPIMTIDRT